MKFGDTPVDKSRAPSFNEAIPDGNDADDKRWEKSICESGGSDDMFNGLKELKSGLLCTRLNAPLVRAGTDPRSASGDELRSKIPPDSGRGGIPHWCSCT